MYIVHELHQFLFLHTRTIYAMYVYIIICTIYIYDPKVMHDLSLIFTVFLAQLYPSL